MPMVKRKKYSLPETENMSSDLSEPQSKPRETFMMKISDLEIFLQFHADTHNTVLNFQNISPENFDLKKKAQCEQIFSNKFRDALQKVAEESKMNEELHSFVKKISKKIRTRDMHTVSTNKWRPWLRTQEDEATAEKKIKDDNACTDDTGVFLLYSRTPTSDVIDKSRLEEMKLRKEEIPSSSESTSGLSDDSRVWLTIPLNAVRQNRIDVLDLCIKTGIDIGIFRDIRGLSLLHEALLGVTDNEMIEKLLTHINKSSLSDSNFPPMKVLMANEKLSCKQKIELMRKLISYGVPLHYDNSTEGGAVQNVISAMSSVHDESMIEDWKQLLDELLSLGVSINSTDWFKHTALLVAINSIPPHGFEDMHDEENSVQNLKVIRKHKMEIVQYLLEKGANPDIRDASGRTCLHNAALSQNVDVVDLIIKHGACVNSLNHLGMTPIYCVCTQGDWSEEEDDVHDILFPILLLLIKSGCDVNKQGKDLSSVLHFAAAKLNYVICKFLLESGADVAVSDHLRRTPLHLSVRNKDTTVIDLLLQFGANLNARDIHNDSPLHNACLFENTTAVQVLLDNGAEVSIVGDLGIQPIHIAAENGNFSMIKFFIDNNADVNVKDNFGATPLHYAAADGNPDSIPCLLDNGADKMIADDMGRKPLDLAKQMGQFKASSLLAENESDVKFGNFPEGLFPNRPLVKMSDVDEYFNNLIIKLQRMRNSERDIGETILNTPGLGKVDFAKGENADIFQIIQQFIDKVLVRVGELDPLFKGCLLNAGSTLEGVKIGYPNEFDFLVHLEHFSSIVERIETSDVPGFSKIFVKSPLPKKYDTFCERSSNYLNAGCILRRFNQLLRLAKYDVLQEHVEHIYTGHMILRDSESVMSNLPIPLGNLVALSVTWRGREFKFLDISIDVNPVVFTTSWPHDVITDCSLMPNLTDKGMYLIPKMCEAVSSWPGELINENTDLWRFSFAHIESEIIQSLPPEGRDCYMLCKTFRLEPLCCSVELDRTGINEPECAFSSRLNQKVSSSDDDQNDDADDDDDENDDDDDDDDDDNDDDDDQIKQNFETAMENYANKNNEIDLNELMDYEEEFGKDEMTAEKLIPSYYIKTLFLKEVELLYKENKNLSNKDLKTMTRKVYDKILTAIETEYLSTLLVPTQNIYHAARHYENEDGAVELRHKFCENILQLLEKLDFKTN
ncbi:uncharacterized protein LOC127732120 [Mytilus californianus]|uniref:uncharacterized protein LOC127732120 n=1 Tax=Mytilus californianus TaxID=6549 RepID=UPI0022462C1D|nr:uncharacterized protein LOC127732120 [Mytilus californianus]